MDGRRQHFAFLAKISWFLTDGRRRELGIIVSWTLVHFNNEYIYLCLVAEVRDDYGGISVSTRERSR